ncbi:hypothetical protein SAMN05216368_10423 [Cryobacterium flavum]|nr:hypothetical protein SAMN05216368_10423 [Cryobacterium flavum]
MFMENPSEASSNTVVVAVEQARDALLAALGGVSFGSLGDEESLSMLLALESVGRIVDGARVLSTTDVLRRSEYLDKSVAATAAEVTADQTELAAVGAVSLARHLGCRSGLVLVSTLARLSRGEVRQRASLGKNAGERMLLGRPLAPTYPVVGEALQGGKLGVEQARVIVKVLDELRPPCWWMTLTEWSVPWWRAGPVRSPPRPRACRAPASRLRRSRCDCRVLRGRRAWRPTGRRRARPRRNGAAGWPLVGWRTTATA